MAGLSRVSISVDSDLLELFDRSIAERRFPTRSEAVKSLMRKALVEMDWQKEAFVSGAITIVYDHHRGSVLEKLLAAQHDSGDIVVCTQHVHLDHHNCLEVIIVRGPSGSIRNLVERLNAIKGLETSALVMRGGSGGHG